MNNLTFFGCYPFQYKYNSIQYVFFLILILFYPDILVFVLDFTALVHRIFIFLLVHRIFIFLLVHRVFIFMLCDFKFILT